MRRKCCLCNDICKRLDFLVFSERTKTVGPVSQHFHLSCSCRTEKNPHHWSKRVGDVDPGGVANLSWVGWVAFKLNTEWTSTAVFKLEHNGGSLEHEHITVNQERTMRQVPLILHTTYKPTVRSLQGNFQPRPWCIDRGIARSILQGWGLRFPCNDQTDEIYKLFIIWPFLYWPEPAIN